ncbi:MAG: recombinase, partial [Rhodoferax sp.]
MSRQPDLTELLDALDPHGTLVQRHLWLIALVGWLRGDARSVAASHSRLALFLDALQQRPTTRQALKDWWAELTETVDATALLADFGFSSRSAFVSEFFERLRLKILPGTPETADAAMLFSLVFDHPFDAQWIAALDEAILLRLGDLLEAPAPIAMVVNLCEATPWQRLLMESITFCSSQVSATGFSPELRL